MASGRVETVMAALKAEGVPVQRGYSGRRIASVLYPKATIRLQRYTEQEETVAVDIFAPVDQGAVACETLALQVRQILRRSMAEVTIGACQYDKQVELFTMQVLGTWSIGPECVVMIGEEQVQRLLACRAEQENATLPYVDSDSGETVTSVVRREWTITIQDIWPLEEAMDGERMDTFCIVIQRLGGVESYSDCRWTQVRLEETGRGILRTRVAQTYHQRVIS